MLFGIFEYAGARSRSGNEFPARVVLRREEGGGGRKY
jgi:hypothetical protein